MGRDESHAGARAQGATRCISVRQSLHQPSPLQGTAALALLQALTQRLTSYCVTAWHAYERGDTPTEQISTSVHEIWYAVHTIQGLLVMQYALAGEKHGAAKLVCTWAMMLLYCDGCWPGNTYADCESDVTPPTQ